LSQVASPTRAIPSPVGFLATRNALQTFIDANGTNYCDDCSWQLPL
jgi:hypothetical protein